MVEFCIILGDVWDSLSQRCTLDGSPRPRASLSNAGHLYSCSNQRDIILSADVHTENPELLLLQFKDCPHINGLAREELGE